MTKPSKKLLTMGLMIGMGTFLSACGGGGSSSNLNEPDLSSKIYVNGCITDGTVLQDGTQKRIADVKVSAQGTNYTGVSFVMSDAMGNFKLPIPMNKKARVWGAQNEGQATAKVTDDVSVDASSVDIQLPACMLLKTPTVVTPPAGTNACVDSFRRIAPFMKQSALLSTMGGFSLTWNSSLPEVYSWKNGSGDNACTIIVQEAYKFSLGPQGYNETASGALVKTYQLGNKTTGTELATKAGGWTTQYTGQDIQDLINSYQ